MNRQALTSYIIGLGITALSVAHLVNIPFGGLVIGVGLLLLSLITYLVGEG